MPSRKLSDNPVECHPYRKLIQLPTTHVSWHFMQLLAELCFAPARRQYALGKGGILADDMVRRRA
jgi:hypothetical protein